MNDMAEDKIMCKMYMCIDCKEVFPENELLTKVLGKDKGKKLCRSCMDKRDVKLQMGHSVANISDCVDDSKNTETTKKNVINKTVYKKKKRDPWRIYKEYFKNKNKKDQSDECLEVTQEIEPEVKEKKKTGLSKPRLSKDGKKVYTDINKWQFVDSFEDFIEYLDCLIDKKSEIILDSELRENNKKYTIKINEFRSCINNLHNISIYGRVIKFTETKNSDIQKTLSEKNDDVKKFNRSTNIKDYQYSFDRKPTDQELKDMKEYDKMYKYNTIHRETYGINSSAQLISRSATNKALRHISSHRAFDILTEEEIYYCTDNLYLSDEY